MTQRKCPKCAGTGLLPYIKPDGTASKYAKVYCDCHSVYGLEPEPGHYQSITPEDYDFPLSDTFRGYSFEVCGQSDPGRIPEPEPAPLEPREVIHRHSDMGKKEFDFLQQTARKLDYLEKKLTEREKPKSQSKKFEYKGIK